MATPRRGASQKRAWADALPIWVDFWTALTGSQSLVLSKLPAAKDPEKVRIGSLGSGRLIPQADGRGTHLCLQLPGPVEIRRARSATCGHERLHPFGLGTVLRVRLQLGHQQRPSG